MKSLKIILFLSAGLIIASQPSFSSKKKKSNISNSCLNCLNSFSATTLNFPKKIRGKCTKILSNCDKIDRTGDCEKVINECFEYNCSATGSCSDATANRALLFGCLSAENKFMPYQCRNYIKGKASSFAKQAKASAEQEKLNKEAEIATAKAEAEKASQEAKIKQTQIETEAKTKQAQIEAENAIKLKEKEQELAIKTIKEQKKEKINSNPNVKYNKALSNVKKAISQAKRESNSIFNQMNIQNVDYEKFCAENPNKKINPIMFDPMYVGIDVISDNNWLSDVTMDMLIRNTKYSTKATTNPNLNKVCFVCNKDVKESFVKSKLENIYKILSTANENLANEIVEIENSNFDETNTQVIEQEKFNILYNLQNNIGAGLKQIQGHTTTLTTSCETRCKGIMAMNFTKKSSTIEFDEKGNIIEDKPAENTGYSCPDLQQTTTANTNKASSPFDMNNMMSFMTSSTQADKDKEINKMMGGMNYQAMEITGRTTKAVLEVDKTLDEINIIAQANRIIGIGNFMGGGSGSAGSSFCSTINPTEFAVCMYPQFKELTRKYEQSNRGKESVIEQIERINSVKDFTTPECNNITKAKNKEKEIEKKTILNCVSLLETKLYDKAKEANQNNSDLLDKLRMEERLKVYERNSYPYPYPPPPPIWK